MDFQLRREREQYVKNRFIELMDELGNQFFERPLYQMGWTFKWMKRKKVIGRCKGGTKQLFYSICFLNNSNDKIDEVIRHEIAHAVVHEITGNPGGHGHYWKSIAYKCGCKNLSMTQSGMKREVKFKYFLICPVCGHKTGKSRKLKRLYSCGKCSPYVFNRKYLMDVVQNY